MDNEFELDWIKVQLTRCCNLKCSFCSQADFRDGQTVDVDLFIDKVLKVAKPRLLIITGGEPLTQYEQLIKLIKYCKANNIEVGIFSNVTLVTDKIAKQLKELNVDWVRTSLNGFTKEIHELSYPVGTFDKTIEGIKRLKENGVYVKARSTVTKGNKDYVEQLVNFVISLGIKELDFRPYLELGDCNPHQDNALNTDEMIAACVKLIQLKEKYKREIAIKLLPNWFDFLYDEWIKPETKYIPETCHCGRQYIYIDSEGNYRACAGHRLILDNMKNHPVSEIWENNKFLNQTRFYKQDEFCSKCPKKIQCHKSNCHLINYEINGSFDKINPSCPIYNLDKEDLNHAIKLLEEKFKGYYEA